MEILSAPILIARGRDRKGTGLILRRRGGDELAVVVDGGDLAGVADVGEGIGGKDDEVGRVAGADQADVEGGVEEVDELTGRAGSVGDGLEGRKAGADEVFELTVFTEAGDAAWGSARVGTIRDEDAGVVERLEVVQRHGMV